MALKYLRPWILKVFLPAAIILTVNQYAFSFERVDGVSMEPTFNNNEYFVLSKVSYMKNKPQYGDVVVFHYPSDPNIDFIKRVIGTPGDTIEIREGHVYRNGVALQEPYLKEAMKGFQDPVVVPKGTLYVLGDNRNNSCDSRFPQVGFVKQTAVVGKEVFRLD